MVAPHYTVEREIAAGGMGVVFLGWDVELERRVAIKVLRPEWASPGGAERFAREARVLARLQHPNIVAVHQAGEAEGLRYFVMDFVPGDTLARRLDREGPLPVEQVIGLGRDLLAALDAAHRAGIVHRDVKPANVFLLENRALLGDFGIARVEPTEDQASSTDGQLIGTPAYMAPEQLARGRATFQADLYAVAMVLYEAATGRRWIPGTDPADGDWQGVPDRLRRVLRRALALHPRDRWADARSFRDALTRRTAPGRWLAAAAVAAAGALAIVVLSHPPRPAAARPRPGSDLAIVPFAGPEGESALGQRLARYVGNELEWFPAWRVTPVPWSFAWWNSAPSTRRAAAPQALGARYYAEGEVLEGDRLLLLSIRDSTGALYYRVSIPGSPDDLIAWSRAAADSMVRALFPRHLDAFRELAAQASRNVQAYSELFAGQESFRHDAWTQAQAHFERALELDPGLAQAAWALLLVRRWGERVFQKDWRRVYTEHRDQLPELQRLLIEAQLEADLPRRFAGLSAAVARYPRNAEALLLFADELFHRGPLAGIPLDSALTAMSVAAEREPFLTAGLHSAWGQIRLGRRARARAAMAELSPGAGPESREARQRVSLVALAYDERFRPWLGAIKRRLLSVRADSAKLDALSRYIRFGLFFDVPSAQHALGGLLARRGRSPATRANGHQARALALVTLGRPRAALAEFDSAAALLRSAEAELQRLEWRVLPQAIGLPTPDSAAAAWARQRLETLAATPAGARAAWALAADALVRGDTERLERWTRRLRDFSADSGAARLGTLLAGLAAAGAREFPRALGLTDPLLSYEAAGLGGDPFARAILYARRGEWLSAGGEPERADRTWLWYEASDVEGWPEREAQAGEVDATAGVYARLRRAGLALRLGDRERACTLAARVRELWSHAEPAYAALRREADSLARACGS